MKKTKFTESQIIGILKEQEQGKSVAEICRSHGISQPTFYGWKSKFSGMEVNQVKRIKELEAELSQYKKDCGGADLAYHCPKGCSGKKL